MLHRKEKLKGFQQALVLASPHEAWPPTALAQQGASVQTVVRLNGFLHLVTLQVTPFTGLTFLHLGPAQHGSAAPRPQRPAAPRPCGSHGPGDSAALVLALRAPSRVGGGRDAGGRSFLFFLLLPLLLPPPQLFPASAQVTAKPACQGTERSLARRGPPERGAAQRRPARRERKAAPLLLPARRMVAAAALAPASPLPSARCGLARPRCHVGSWGRRSRAGVGSLTSLGGADAIVADAERHQCGSRRPQRPLCG